MTAYKIIYRQRAIKEYSESLAWYKKYSFQAAENFKLIIENTVNYIAQNPRSFKNSYKKFYIARTGRFPFIIVFFIEDERIIVITTIFHNKRNPAKKYRL
ncbi:MAG: type II toxin-antitoxin system RelE/ParE family toxin [Parafilimonas sp.]